MAENRGSSGIKLLDRYLASLQNNPVKTGGMTLLVIGVIWVVITGLYTVDADERAVIQRFGKYQRLEKPGLNIKWPDGIETKTNVKVDKVFTQEFGLRTREAGVSTDYEDSQRYLEESLMLTGDLNCAIVPWIVQYRKSDPVAYLFNVRDVEGTLRDLSEAVVREVVGDRSINEVISDRLSIANQAKDFLQKAIKEAGAGVEIINLELKNTTVPRPVQPSFNEVNQALQDKERIIQEARKTYNQKIPELKGKAEQMVKEAEGYRINRLNVAKGDSSMYIRVFDAYKKNRDVTRRRMYLETMSDLLPRIGDKYIVDEDQESVLPLLNIKSGGGIK